MLVGKCIWWGTWDSPTLPLTFHPGGMRLTCQDAGHVLPSVLTAKNLMEITSPIQWMPTGLLLFPYNLKRFICIIINEYLIKIYFHFLITTFRMWPPSYLKSCSKIGFIFFLSEKTVRFGNLPKATQAGDEGQVSSWIQVYLSLKSRITISGYDSLF